MGIGARKVLRNWCLETFEELLPVERELSVGVLEVHRDSVKDVFSAGGDIAVPDKLAAVQ